ncbi:hypothetical protein RM704_06260 [Streptomyces sp. DSM 3412]|uniref:Uncharacterized protein n=1 Tax=Streptomyces gottesmaniae TaxID=3075518 RepID=A0ABU2YSX5_9ACTN|nr:hypothetical protein [Streptomyces sp. DSM 3412]MDT0567079.1 hypothetical protein [Streptomyces sp. DSM 3412]
MAEESRAAVDAPAAVSLPRAERAPQSSRRPAVKKAAPANTAAQGGAYAHGPLLVLDADAERQVTGYGVGGLIVDVPAESLPALIEWTLAKARLGSEKLHGSGKDGDPLLVLTEAACERYGLPAFLSEAERLAGRLPEGHKVIRPGRTAAAAGHAKRGRAETITRRCGGGSGRARPEARFRMPV